MIRENTWLVKARGIPYFIHRTSAQTIRSKLVGVPFQDYVPQSVCASVAFSVSCGLYLLGSRVLIDPQDQELKGEAQAFWPVCAEVAENTVELYLLFFVFSLFLVFLLPLFLLVKDILHKAKRFPCLEHVLVMIINYIRSRDSTYDSY